MRTVGRELDSFRNITVGMLSITISVSVCLFVCLSVRLSDRMSQKQHDQFSRNVLYMLPILWFGPPMKTVPYVIAMYCGKWHNSAMDFRWVA